MEGHQVSTVKIDIFDDVNLSANRPGCALPKCPKRGPSTANTGRHVGKIKNEKTMVVGSLAGKTDRRTASGVGRIKNIVVINAPLWRTSTFNETAVGGIVVSEVVGVAQGRVCSSVEVEHVKEVLSIVIFEGVASRLDQREGGADGQNERKGQHLHRRRKRIK